jgi:hypothetical protein
MSPCQLINHQLDFQHSRSMNSSPHTVHVDSEIDTENWVAADSKIVIETASPADAWFRLRAQSLLTR